MTDPLKVLSNPPSMREKKLALVAVNARVAVLQSQLGIAPTMFEFNPNRATARLLELEKQATAKNLTLAPAAAAAPDSRSVKPTGAATLDAAVAASGTRNLRAF